MENKITGRTKAKRPPHIVGIGASAGGLEALQAFFGALESGEVAAWVVVQHVSAQHKSLMDELLAKRTAMPVTLAKDGERVEAGRVYLIPPGKTLALEGGALAVRDKDPNEKLQRPVDVFFQSLAKASGERAAGVVLSGTGTDGARGLLAIKEAGGLVLAQDPATAQFDGMPDAAIRYAAPDLVLPPGELARSAARYAQTGARRSTAKADGDDMETPETRDAFEQLLETLFKQTQIDFSAYRTKTLLRRIQKRMRLRNTERLNEYLKLARKEPEEARNLAQDFLISVTQFFRDPEAWDYLRAEILPQLFSSEVGGKPVRVWTAGCATGEETYTLAMLLSEVRRQWEGARDFKIFATDLDARAVKTAQLGIYPEHAAAETPPELLARYFTREDGALRAKNRLREKIVFAVQDVLADPPFINLDLVVCRNLLIYFKPDAQQAALANFHFGMKPGAFLMLGASENAGEMREYFETVHNKHNIFRRGAEQLKKRPARLNRSIGLMQRKSLEAPRLPGPVAGVQTPEKEKLGRARNFEAFLAEHFAPVVIFIDQNYDIQYVHGEAGRLLRFPSGKPEMNLLRLVGKDEALALRNGARKIFQGELAVEYKGLAWRPAEDDAPLKVNAAFFPAEIETEPAPLTAVALRLGGEAGGETPASERDFTVAAEEADRVRLLENELDAAQYELQKTIEELETTNEELQSSNEELLSSNEELQSSNEELQSVNEELYSVNNELQEKIREVTQANADVDNIIVSSGVGVVFLDAENRIRRFTPSARALFNIREEDLGRPITDLTTKAPYPDLERDLEEAAARETPTERKLETRDGHWYLARIQPYQTGGGFGGGAVLSIIEITEMEQTHRELRARESLLVTAQETARLGVWRWDAAEDAYYVSPMLREIFGIAYDPAQPNAYQLAPDLSDRIPPEDLEALVAHMRAARQGDAQSQVVFRYRRPGAPDKTLYLQSRVSSLEYDSAGALTGAVGITQDVTAVKQFERRLAAEERRFRDLTESIRDLFFAMDKNLVYTYWNKASERALGIASGEAVGQSIYDLFPQIRGSELEAFYLGVLEHGEQASMVSYFPINGEDRHFELYAYPFDGGISVFARDVTLRARSQAQLEDALAREKELNQELANVQERLEAQQQELTRANKRLIKEKELLDFSQQINKIGSYTWELEAGRLFWSDQMFDIFGIEKTENGVVDLSQILDRILEEDMPAVEVFMEAAAKGDFDRVLEYRIAPYPGEIRHIFVTGGGVIRDEAGKPAKVYGSVQDVTEQKLAEMKIQESEARFRLLANSAPVMIWTSDAEGACDYFNQQWLDFTGRTLEQEIGKGWTDSMHLEERGYYLEVFWDAFAQRKPFSAYYRLKNRDGEYRWIYDVGAPRISDDGDFLGYIGSSMDVTEKREKDDQIKAALKEKEALLSEVHHRVKNNMAVISSLLGLQARKFGDPALGAVLKESQQRIQAMALIHEQLYSTETFSSIDFDDYLRFLAEHLEKLYKPEDKDITIELKLESGAIGLVKAVPAGLLVNELLTNAYKHAFTETYRGKIAVEYKQEDGMNYLTVSDDGKGFPEDLDWDFPQSLGLMLVTQLTGQLEGEFKTSNTGPGARFELTFAQ